MAKYQFYDEFVKDMKETHPEVWAVNHNYAKIIAQIIAKRDKLGWSQAELASKCGLKQSAIARLEMCSNMPRLDTVLKVMGALGLEIEVNEKELKSKKLVNLSMWKIEKEKGYQWNKPREQNEEFEIVACMRA